MEQEEGWEVFESNRGIINAANWLPRSRKQNRLLDTLREMNMSTVDKLFDVRQGTKTGRDKTFVISRADYSLLPPRERRFFRPAASSSTIQNGQLCNSEFVFYPYDDTGLLLHSEDELQRRLPTYYANYLRPVRDILKSRPRVDPNQWWKLIWERNWQHGFASKLVSKSYGEVGSFAYDKQGDYVVVQGLGWIWKEESDDLDFHHSELPWAYLSLFNSRVFEALLACYCPRVRGGQFDLSEKYVSMVYLPNLADEMSVTADC
ncbi:MAG: hypothetical protein M1358_20740, partial [Chloroflexi bacterium]|nr:hypothetical protein [Chloroflexota bacterium]